MAHEYKKAENLARDQASIETIRKAEADHVSLHDGAIDLII